MRGGRRWVFRAGAGLVLVLAIVAALSFVVMVLWNVLMPDLFHGPRLGFWQAAGLLVLCRILFGGWRGRGGPGAWRLRERWKSLTPEERARLKERLGHCGWGPAPDATQPPPS